MTQVNSFIVSASNCPALRITLCNWELCLSDTLGDQNLLSLFLSQAWNTFDWFSEDLVPGVAQHLHQVNYECPKVLALNDRVSKIRLKGYTETKVTDTKADIYITYKDVFTIFNISYSVFSD
ncbi:hypothetical protein PoB_001273800 [Plakobranchus ocellatus]|uniref:Uncharacterized protein n=1 Tax=Plakobranchus ocellatus TaxID=259542 RepID=A0AAV3YV55_9GAST|nr:hypothetical protein PoB_001273800 [Plakobranchus ocellatus]